MIKHTILPVFNSLLKSCPNPNVFGDKVSCLWKLSPNILYPRVLHCRYMIKYMWNFHGCFILKVLNPTNSKFQVAFSTSFLWGTQSSSVLNLLPSMPYLCTTSGNRNSQWMIHKSTISALRLPSAVPIKPSSSNTNTSLVVLLPLPPPWDVLLKTRMSNIKQITSSTISALRILL